MGNSRVAKIQFSAMKVVVLVKLRSHELFIENYF